MTTEEIKKIIADSLPGFWCEVAELRFLSVPYTRIWIAASDHKINAVPGQLPQVVTLTYQDGVLNSHHSRIYRDPRPFDKIEGRLVMVGVKIPFRKNKAGHEVECLKRFCASYLQVLRENKEVLRYRDIVDYDKLLNPIL